MSARAAVRQAEIARAVRAAIAGSHGTGKTMQVVIEGGRIIMTPVDGAVGQSDALDAERRMREAFGE